VGAADATNSENHLTMLINNVGVATQPLEAINEQKLDTFDAMIKVNALFPAKLTALLAPFLLRNKRSAMINLSSFSSRVPVPFLTTYAATKAFNVQFSKCVNMELRHKGCDVLAVTPSYVASAMTGTTRTNLARCSAKDCAVGTLNKLGLVEASPYWFHAIQEFVTTKVLPTFMLEPMLLSNMKQGQARERRTKEAAAKKGQETKS